MSVLLIGLVCFVAALRVGRETVRPAGAVAWYALVALVVVGQLAWGADRVDRWRFTLLGLRYRVADEAGVRSSSVTVGGSVDADLRVGGAGEGAVASLSPVGDEAVLSLSAAPVENPGAALLVEEPGGWVGGGGWSVLGGVPLGVGDTLMVRGDAGEYRMVRTTVPDTARLLDGEIPLPWVERDALALVGVPARADGAGGRGGDGAGGVDGSVGAERSDGADRGEGAADAAGVSEAAGADGAEGTPGAEDAPPAVVLPTLETSLLQRFRSARPSVLQRTYPVADVLDGAAPRAGGEGAVGSDVPPLASFLYYRGDSLMVALLDPEVSLASGREGGAVTVWTPEEGGRRLLVAGFPHRDFPEPDLTLPERYGVRPLRSVRPLVRGPWLDLAFTSPEVRALDRAEVEALALPAGGAWDDASAYRLRLAPAGDPLARRALTFDAPSEAFDAEARAVFRLAREPGERAFGVLAPAGLATWETGRPLPLGSRERALLLRVDGEDTGAGFWALLAVALAVPALVLLKRPASGPVFALALAAAGLGAVRLLLAVPAALDPPYSQEAVQTALWVLPLLPWAVVLAAEVGRGVHRPDAGGGGRLVLGAPAGALALHGGVAVTLAALAAALFGGSPAKQGVLALVSLALAAGWWLAARRPVADVDGPHLDGPDARAEGPDPHGPAAHDPDDREPPARAAHDPRAAPDAPRARTFGPDGRTVPPAGAGSALFRRARAAVEARPWLLRGWTLGAALLLLRVALEALGWREQVTVGGTRIGVSVLYTPLLVAGLALLLHRQGLRVARAGWGPGFPAAVAWALLNVAAYVALAYVAVSGWISDFGIALVLLPGALLLLALVGRVWAPAGRPGRVALLGAALPLAAFVLLQAAPGLLSPVVDAPGEGATPADARLEEWNRNELLLLERGDPDALRMIGQRRSEALAVMRETMRSYTRGNWGGKGWLRGRMSPEIAETAPREHSVSALLASQLGFAGSAGLVLLLLSLLPPATSLLLEGGDPARAGPRPRGGAGALTLGLAFAGLVLAARLLPSPLDLVIVGAALLAAAVLVLAPATGYGEGRWWEGGEPPVEQGAPPRLPLPGLLAAGLLLTVAAAGLYMVAANYGLAFFTGKNVYLLGLDSVGDVLESLALLGVAAWALGRAEPPPPLAVARPDPMWWHAPEREAA